MKMFWASDGLYIGADMEEPHVWGTLREHDSVIFQDNDFEVFLDPDGDHHLYVELELNALNTTWDLLLVRPYLWGGPPVDGFELAGLRSAVHVDGTLNDPRDADRGWSVEIMIPWKALTQVAGRACPPHPGDVWRINFSRVQWRHQIVDGRYRKVPDTPEDNWVWSPQGVVDMHRPDRWGLLQFIDGEPGAPPRLEPERVALVAAFEAQAAFRKRYGRFARDAKELGAKLVTGVTVHGIDTMFEARLNGWRIDHEFRLTRTPP